MIRPEYSRGNFTKIKWKPFFKFVIRQPEALFFLLILICCGIMLFILKDM